MCCTHVAKRRSVGAQRGSVPMATSSTGARGLRPTLPPTGPPWSPGRGCSSSPGRRLGALELVPEVTRSPVSPSDRSLGAVFFPVSCLGLCVIIWLRPLPSQSACGFGTVRLEGSDVSPPAPLPAAASLWNPDAVAHPRRPRWKPAGGLRGRGAASHSAEGRHGASCLVWIFKIETVSSFLFF